MMMFSTLKMFNNVTREDWRKWYIMLMVILIRSGNYWSVRKASTMGGAVPGLSIYKFSYCLEQSSHFQIRPAHAWLSLKAARTLFLLKSVTKLRQSLVSTGEHLSLERLQEVPRGCRCNYLQLIGFRPWSSWVQQILAEPGTRSNNR